MANKFGRIDSSESSFEEQIFHKNQTLTSASVGVNYVLGLKDHYKPGTSTAGGGLLSVSGSHWAFVHGMFYMSGSQKVSETMPADAGKFNSIYHNFNQYNDLKPPINQELLNTLRGANLYLVTSSQHPCILSSSALSSCLLSLAEVNLIPQALYLSLYHF